MSGVIAWGLDPTTGENGIKAGCELSGSEGHRTEEWKRRNEAASTRERNAVMFTLRGLRHQPVGAR